MGWGASSQFGKINGQWTDTEKDLHINNLELLAIFISLKLFKRNFLGKHVRIMNDSATASTYVNNMGGSRSITYHKLKLVSTIFYQIFIFSSNDDPSKTMNNVFYFI